MRRDDGATEVAPTRRLNITIGLLVILLGTAVKIAHSLGQWQRGLEEWQRQTDRRLDLLEGRRFYREVPPEFDR